MKKIINFIKQKLFTTELLFSNEFCVNEEVLAINNFATDGFITQDGNNSAFHAVPVYKIREHEPLVVFEELISEIKKQIPKFDLDEILSGFFMFSGRRYTFNPRGDIKYGVRFMTGIQTNRHFMYEPTLLVNFDEEIYNIEDMPYIIQQLHFLQGIMLTYWRREASMNFSSKKFKISKPIKVWNFNKRQLHEVQRIFNTGSIMQFYIKSNTKFDRLGWEQITIV